MYFFLMIATSYSWSYIDLHWLIHWLLIHLILLTLIIMTQTPKQNSDAAAGGVLKNFAIFTEKKIYVGVFFYKVASLQNCIVIKKWLLHRCFCVNFEKFLRAPILKNIHEWLLLSTDYFIIYWFIQFTTVHAFHFCK